MCKYIKLTVKTVNFYLSYVIDDIISLFVCISLHSHSVYLYFFFYTMIIELLFNDSLHKALATGSLKEKIASCVFYNIYKGL